MYDNSQKSLASKLITPLLFLYSIPVLAIISAFEPFGFKMTEEKYDPYKGKTLYKDWKESKFGSILVPSSIISTIIYLTIFLYS